MTAIADLVAHLVSTGIPPEALARAVDLAQLHAKESAEFHRSSGGIPVDAAAERRRAFDRERKAAKANSTGKSTGIPPDDDSALSVSSSPEIKKEEKKERAKRDRGHVCPDDMLPSESHYGAGARQNISRPRVDACCGAMKLWSKSNSNRAVARKVDWNAALFGWIEREAERTAGKPNGNAISLADAFAEHRRDLADLARDGGGFEDDDPVLDLTPAGIQRG